MDSEGEDRGPERRCLISFKHMSCAAGMARLGRARDDGTGDASRARKHGQATQLAKGAASHAVGLGHSCPPELSLMSDRAPYIRPLSPNDLSQLVPLHLAAFAGSLGVSLGRRYVHDFLRWFIARDDAIKLGCADEDGRLIGYVFGAPQGYTTDLNRHMSWRVALAVVTHPWLVARRAFLSALPNWVRALRGKTHVTLYPVGAFLLVGIGVDPACRGRGIGRVLIREFEAQVRAGGYTTVFLAVRADNVAARRLYEASSWEPASAATQVMIYRRCL